MAVNDTVHDLVVAALAGHDVELYDLEHTGGVLRVTVQRPGGVDIDTIAEITRAVSRRLDETDPIPGSYQLEVSSPGLERTLRTAAHWQGAVGERVKVKTVPNAEGERRVDGTVAEVGVDAVTIDLADGERRTLRLDEVERARTVFEWGPAPKPGGPKKAGKSGTGTAAKAGTQSQSGPTKEKHT